MKRLCVLAGLLVSFTTHAQNEKGAMTLVKYDYKPEEITKLTDVAIKTFDTALEKIVATPDKQKNFENTFVALDRAATDFEDATSLLGFMKDVSTSKVLRDEATKSEEKVSEYAINVFTRRDLYNALLMAEKNTPKKGLSDVDKRLMTETIKDFKRNGLFLPDKELEEVKKLQQEMAKLSVAFSSNINEDKSSILLTAKELEGVPQSFLDRLEKNGEKFKVTAKSTDYVVVMDNAKNSETRRRMMLMYENRAADKNPELLKKIIVLRQAIAKKLHYKTWADYKTEDRMAKSGKKAFDFLTGLQKKIAKRYKKDLEILLAYKKTEDPKAKTLNPWDPRYLEYQIKKNKYTLDSEVIREYFPSDRTVEKMFEIYAQLLGVKFVRIKDAAVWSPDVQMYEIQDAKTGKVISHFYTDFIPREGKYSHAAAFSLISGRVIDGEYQPPVSAIVANFEPPANGKPSLLDHDQVETLFHEFGHIMHQTLTTAKYGSLSGTKVARDFVEAPSQMLENWVWDPKILKEVSGHYKDPSKKLPDEIIAKLLESRDFNQGYFYDRQLLFGIFDMTLHTSAKAVDDPTAVYKRLYKEVTSMEPLKETNFPASFGHLMGYDAGYYGYLWSKVFAEDMFTLFEKDGLLNQKVGGKYRNAILAQGNTKDASKLLVEFLGRNPSNKAFLKRLEGGGKN